MVERAKRREWVRGLLAGMRADGYSARVVRLAALDAARCWTVRWEAPAVEVIGRVIWDAKIAAARAALRARVVEEWAATGGALRLPGPLALRGSQGKALAVLRRYPIKHPRGLLGVAIEGRVIRDWHLAQARAALLQARRNVVARDCWRYVEPAVAIVGAVTAGDTGPGWWTCFAVRGAGGRLLAMY